MNWRPQSIMIKCRFWENQRSFKWKRLQMNNPDLENSIGKQDVSLADGQHSNIIAVLPHPNIINCNQTFVLIKPLSWRLTRELTWKESVMWFRYGRSEFVWVIKFNGLFGHQGPCKPFSSCEKLCRNCISIALHPRWMTCFFIIVEVAPTFPSSFEQTLLFTLLKSWILDTFVHIYYMNQILQVFI